MDAEPEYDAYKRGAFLEKQNRFSADKASDTPGPVTLQSGMHTFSVLTLA